jgi:hypothetical protein
MFTNTNHILLIPATEKCGITSYLTMLKTGKFTNTIEVDGIYGEDENNISYVYVDKKSGKHRFIIYTEHEEGDKFAWVFVMFDGTDYNSFKKAEKIAEKYSDDYSVCLVRTKTDNKICMQNIRKTTSVNFHTLNMSSASRVGFQDIFKHAVINLKLKPYGYYKETDNDPQYDFEDEIKNESESEEDCISEQGEDEEEDEDEDEWTECESEEEEEEKFEDNEEDFCQKPDSYYIGTLPEKITKSILLKTMKSAIQKYSDHYESFHGELPENDHLIDILDLWFEHDSNRDDNFDHLIPDVDGLKFFEKILEEVKKEKKK